MSDFVRDGLRFDLLDDGPGLPFVFQHGLGGTLNQPRAVYGAPEDVRLITFDMRGHGETHPLGDVEKLTIATFADDLIALIDHLQIERAVVGGISLGAAVAVNVALRYPERVLGLIVVRPAWIDQPLPENVALYSTIARLIRELGPEDGLAEFRKWSIFRFMERDSPDCALSLVGQFKQPLAAERVARLERLITDTPCPDRALYGNLRVPALVAGNRQDPIHPWALAQSLSELIPGAILREVTPKSESPEQHAVDAMGAINEFLNHHFLGSR